MEADKVLGAQAEEAADEVITEAEERSLLELWREKAYDQRPENKKRVGRLWDDYYKVEKEIYRQLLSGSGTPVTGTVKELAEKYGTDLMTMTGFLDGINDSLKEPNPIETMKEDTAVTLDYEPEKLFRNMVDAKADWLYGLEEWERFYSPEKRKELLMDQKRSRTVVKGPKIGRNDPCPCGSGKKYKFCCGKSA